ncbi:MAG: Dehydrogenases (flavoprotein) [uncultured archaeon A07HR60]|nr:MAG: Dehydrogenases (flavoprotein) [uncultured archaeon A07HR60]
MESVDVAIVGGGPAGSSAAHAAASGGAETIALEKGIPREDREGMGPDSTDAAGILDYWVDIMGIHPDEFPEGVILQELDRAEFRGPDTGCTLHGTGIESSYDSFGYTFHRARFDDFLRSRAEDAGAEYRVGTAVRDVDTDLAVTPASAEPRHVVQLADGSQLGAEYLILADGPQRRITNRVLDRYLPAETAASERLASTDANHIAYQEYRRFPEELFEEIKDALVFWWGVMPGETAYPWVFPNADQVCRVGLTMPIGAELGEVEDPGSYELLRADDESIPRGSEYIGRLLDWQYGDEYSREDFPIVEDAGKRDGTETYSISSTRPIESPTGAGIAVVGGAMGTTSAFHEGGDHTAVRTGAIAGELAASGNFTDYNRRWKAALEDELLRNVTMADIVSEYTPSDWDRVIGCADAMLATETGTGLLERTYSAGWQAAKLFLSYRWNKRQARDDYVQLLAGEYSY